MRFKLLLLAGLMTAVSACTYTPAPDHSENNVIGSKLTAVSSLTTEQGTDQPKVALYDSTVDMIHQFDLSTGGLDRSLYPRYPGGTHYVLFDPTGNYVIDLTLKHISIFDKSGVRHEPLSFVGTPQTASFRPSLGDLVIYDDLHSVALIQLDSNGNVTGQAVLGPIVSSNISITSGDIDDQGRLVLSLSDNTIALIDIGQSIATNGWVYWNGQAPFTTALTDIDWLAPVHDKPNQILVKTKTNPQVALVDVVAKTVLGTPVAVGSDTVIKTSKSFDPHILISRSNGQVDMVYAKNSALRTTTTFNQMNNLLSSRLSLSGNTWSIVDANVQTIQIGIDIFGLILYDDPNAAPSYRTFKKYNASTLAPISQIPLPDYAKLQLTEAHIFELYPNKLGYAVNHSIADGAETKLQMFNYPYLHNKD